MKFLVVSPIGPTGRNVLFPHICEGIRDCGFEFIPFDFDSLLPINYEGLRRKIEGLTLREKTNFVIKTVYESLMEVVIDYKPDVILDIFPLPEWIIKKIKKMKKMGIITAWWFLEDGFSDTFSSWKDIAYLYDFFFTINSERLLDIAKAFGVRNSMVLHIGCNPKVHKPLLLTPSEREVYESDLSFMGSLSPNREEVFSKLVDYDFKIWCRLGGKRLESKELKEKIEIRDWIDEGEALKIYNAAKINLNFHTIWDRMRDQKDFVNPRTLVLSACGAFQLVDKREKLPELFNIGEEMITFDSVEDLKEKIDYYLGHPKERKEIAERARRRALKEHTYAHRIKEMVEFIRSRSS